MKAGWDHTQYDEPTTESDMVEAHGTPTGDECQRPTCESDVYERDGELLCTKSHSQIRHEIRHV